MIKKDIIIIYKINMNIIKILMINNCWKFWIDCGGIFIDIVVKFFEGKIIIYKLLLENLEYYFDVLV